MLLSLLQKLLSSISKVLFKRTLLLADVPVMLFFLITQIIGLILGVGLVLSYGGEINVQQDVRLLLGIVAVVLIGRLNIGTKVFLLKKERLSELIPFDNIHTLLTIILGFFIFHESSSLTMILGIVAFFVLMIAEFDLKNIKAPKYFGKILKEQLLRTLQALLIARIMKSFNKFDYYLISQLVLVLFLIVYVIQYKELTIKSSHHKGFWTLKSIQSTLSQSSAILYLFVVSTSGVVVATLLSFLSATLTIFFGRIFLKEKPKTKDIIINLIVLGLVGFGYYFK